MLKGKNLVPKVGNCDQMLGIAVGNKHKISRTRTGTRTCRVKSIENCFGHHRISNNAVMTLKVSKLSQSWVDDKNYLRALQHLA